MLASSELKTIDLQSDILDLSSPQKKLCETLLDILQKKGSRRMDLRITEGKTTYCYYCSQDHRLHGYTAQKLFVPKEHTADPNCLVLNQDGKPYGLKTRKKLWGFYKEPDLKIARQYLPFFAKEGLLFGEISEEFFLPQKIVAFDFSKVQRLFHCIFSGKLRQERGKNQTGKNLKEDFEQAHHLILVAPTPISGCAKKGEIFLVRPQILQAFYRPIPEKACHL